MFHTINKFLDEPYINFVIKNNGMQGLKAPIFDMLRPLLVDVIDTSIIGFSEKSKIINGSNKDMQRNRSFKSYQQFQTVTSLYCVLIFLNDRFKNGNIKLYSQSGNELIAEVVPTKGLCLVFDNNLYYSYCPYELISNKVDRVILKTFIMGLPGSRPCSPTISRSTRSMVIPTRTLSIKRDMSLSPTNAIPSGPIFEFSPTVSPIVASPITSPIVENELLADDNYEIRSRTLSDPPVKISAISTSPPLSPSMSPLGRLGSHRLTSASMCELPTVTPVSSPVNYLPHSQSDMEKNTIYKRLSKLSSCLIYKRDYFL